MCERVLATALACMAGLALSGCRGLTPSAATSAHDWRIAYTGRFEAQPAGEVRFAWAGSRIDLRFSGTSLRMRLTDVPVDDELRETDWFDVSIDGASPRALHVREGSHVYTLAQALSRGVHRLAIVKRTEPEVGTATLHDFLLERDRNLIPELPKRRQLELIGDSITTGYGNLGRGTSCAREAQLENVEQAYGAVAARALDAGYTAIAWSGKGVLRNFDGGERGTLPDLYERSLPADPRPPAVTTRPTIELSSTPSADAVVVNLGTNDFFAGVPDRARFIAAYRGLLARVRARHPSALLVLIVGPILADDFPQPDARSSMREWLTTVRNGLRDEGDRNVEVLEAWSDRDEGLGCDRHPSAATHARLGRELAARLRTRLSW